MAHDPTLSVTPSRDLVRMLGREADPSTGRDLALVRLEGRTAHVSPFDSMHTDVVRLGWRYLPLLYDALVEVDPDRFMGCDVRLSLGAAGVRSPGLADVYASNEDSYIEFEGTMMAASERQSVDHLMRVDDGTVIYADDYNPRNHGDIKAISRMDMQEVIIEDVSDRDRPRRINSRLYGQHLVDRFQRGQKLHIQGVYRSEMRKTRRGPVYTYWVEVLEAVPIDDAEAPSWTEDEVAAMRADVRRLGARKFLEALADSLCPQVPGNFWPKVAALLSAVGGSTIQGEPPNIHALLVGEPGTGKSAIMMELMSMLKSSAYGVAESMSARGMTYGMEEWDGKKMLAAGVMVLKRHVGVDEFTAFSRETLDGIKVVLSDQVAAYHKTGFHVETPVDCSVVACGNPKGDVWNPAATTIENLGVPAAVVTRMNVFRVKMQKDHKGRSARIKAHMLGLPEADPPVPRERLAHWLEWAAAADDPVLLPAAADALEAFFITFWDVEQKPTDEVLVQVRMEKIAYRNACALARLLGSPEVTPEHAHLAVELFSESMKSLGLRVDELDALTNQLYDKTRSFLNALNVLEARSGEEGFELEDIADYLWRGGVFKSLDASRCWVFGAPGTKMVEQHLYRPASAGGRYRKQ